MYLLLILLVSPTLGRPSSDQLDVGTEISNQLHDILEFNNETGKIFLDSTLTTEVIKMILEAEQSIHNMTAELKTLGTQFNDTYFPKYNEAKSYLRQSRRDLRELADRTVKDVRDLKIFLGALDESKDSSAVNFYLKILMNRMKDLMIKTLKTLKNAKGKYNLARETFDLLKQQIKTENEKLGKLVEKREKNWEKSKLWEKWEKLLLLDQIIGQVDKFICIGKNIISFDEFLACKANDSLKEIAKLKTISDRMLETGNNFDQAINVAIDVLEDEIDIIGKWTQSAKAVEASIDEYPVETLRLLKPIRTIFVTGLDNLKNAAEEFLAQPKNILTLKD